LGLAKYTSSHEFLNSSEFSYQSYLSRTTALVIFHMALYVNF